MKNEKQKIDQCVKISRELNQLEHDDILLIYRMLSDERKDDIEFCYLYNIVSEELDISFEDKIIFLNKTISDYYEVEYNKTLLEFLKERIVESNIYVKSK